MDRPVGVTMIAILYFLCAVVLVLVGVGEGSLVLARLLRNRSIVIAVPAMGIAALRLLSLVAATLAVLLGWSLMRLKNWARIVTMIVAGFNILRGLLWLFAVLFWIMESVYFRFSAVRFWLATSSEIGIGAGIIWYLMTAKVRAAFQMPTLQAHQLDLPPPG